MDDPRARREPVLFAFFENPEDVYDPWVQNPGPVACETSSGAAGTVWTNENTGGTRCIPT
jgi:hypothetical protein